MQLYFNNGCATFFGEREFTVYGGLTVSGTTWRFAVLPNTTGSTAVFDLTMELQQTSGRLSGTVYGTAIDPVSFPIRVYGLSGSVAVPALAAGTVGADGNAAGTLDGVLNFGHPSFGLGGVCTGADLPWALKSFR